MALQQAGLEWVCLGLDIFIESLYKGNDAMEKVGDGSEKASGKMSLASGIVMSLASSITSYLVDAATKGAQALGGLVMSSIGAAQEFEGAATRLKIAGTGAAAQAGIALEDLSEAALKVGGDTRLMGVNATDSAEAITNLLKAGLSVNDIMGDFDGYMNEGARLSGVLAASINLAAATELDMVDASTLASTTMTIFGLSAEEIGGKMDYIVRGADASVASVSDIRDALEGAGPTLRGFGFTVEDSVDALSLLSNAGITGAEAGTALRSAWTQMTSDKSKVVDALSAQGVALTDANGKYVSFAEVLGQLEVATNNMTEAEKSEFLQTIAGAYGKTALTALINQGTEGYEKYALALEGAAGIEAQSTENAKTLGAAQEALSGTMETLKIKIGTAFLPVITGVTRAFGTIVEKNGPMLIGIFENIGAAIAPLVDWFTNAITTGDLFGATFRDLPEPIQGIITKISDFKGKIDNAITSITPFIEWLKEFKETGKLLNPEIVGLSDPLQNIIMKVVELKGSFQEFMAKAQPFIDWFKEFAGTGKMLNSEITGLPKPIQDLIIKFIEFKAKATDSFEKFKKWIDENWPKIAAVIITAWKVISSVVMGVVEALKPTIMELIDTLKKVDWEYVGKTVKTVFLGIAAIIGAVVLIVISIITGLVNAITGVVETIIEIWNNLHKGIKDVIDKFKSGDILGALKSFRKTIVEAFLAPFKIIWAAVSKFVGGIIDFFKGLFDTLVGNSIIPDMMKAIKDTINKVLAQIIDIVETWIDNVVQFFIDLKAKIQTTWDNLWKIVKDKLDDAISAIKNAIDSFVTSVKAKWEAFKTSIETTWNTMWETIKTTVKSVWDNILLTITTTFQNIITTVSTNMQGILDKINEYASSLIEKGRAIVQWIIDGLVEHWATLVETIRTKLSEILSAIKEKATSLLEAGKEIVVKLRDGFVEMWNDPNGLIAKIKEKFGTIKESLSNAWQNVVLAGGEIVNKLKDGLVGMWDSLTTAIKNAIVNDKTGILAAIVSGASGIIEAGGKIVDYLIQGVQDNWQKFKDWLTQLIKDWFTPNDSTPPGSSVRRTGGKSTRTSARGITEGLIEGIGDSFSSMLPNLIMQVAALPVMSNVITRDVNNSRSTSIEVNASYANSQSEADIYYDVSAALAGARI